MPKKKPIPPAPKPRQAQKKPTSRHKAAPPIKKKARNKMNDTADKKPSMGAAGSMTPGRNISDGEKAVQTRSQEPQPGKAEDVINRIRTEESQQKETAQRGAGSGEEAVLTRSRNYNETVPGAFPAVVSPTPEQSAEIQAAQDLEDAAKIEAASVPVPAAVPHSSVEKPISRAVPKT